jgi:hypothetical protein
VTALQRRPVKAVSLSATPALTELKTKSVPSNSVSANNHQTVAVLDCEYAEPDNVVLRPVPNSRETTDCSTQESVVIEVKRDNSMEMLEVKKEYEEENKGAKWLMIDKRIGRMPEFVFVVLPFVSHEK